MKKRIFEGGRDPLIALHTDEIGNKHTHTELHCAAGTFSSSVCDCAPTMASCQKPPKAIFATLVCVSCFVLPSCVFRLKGSRKPSCDITSSCWCGGLAVHLPCWQLTNRKDMNMDHCMVNPGFLLRLDKYRL